jgi:hypothetical protein
MRTLAIVAALLATLAGCRSTPKKGEQPIRTVSDVDVGRLAPAQMAPLQAARSSLVEARDALARAQHRLQESRHEEAWANADKAAAESDRLRAAAQLASAKDSGDQRLAGVASERGEAAGLRGQAAEARLDYARKLVQAREADVKAQEARVRRAEWEVERAKIAALREAELPAASKYDPAPIDMRIGEAVRAEEAARTRARDLDATARAAFDTWRGLTDRYEARARSLPAG